MTLYLKSLISVVENNRNGIDVVYFCSMTLYHFTICLHLNEKILWTYKNKIQNRI